MRTIVPMPVNYTDYCKRLYSMATGCVHNGEVVMRFGFSKRAVEKARCRKQCLLFATDQWEVYVDFCFESVLVKAPNSNIGSKLLPTMKTVHWED